MIKIKNGAKYLVTGGSGFLGGALIDRILDQGGLVVTIARNEGNLIKLKQRYHNNGLAVQIYSGDIADHFAVESCMKDIKGIFHLAAFKHVTMAETQAKQCTAGNVVGSMNVLDLAAKYGVDFVLGISTDKAAQIAGVYGASKYIMEKIFEEYQVTHPDTLFRIVRYGNVLYSTGSVLCKWRDLLEAGQEVVVTDPTATRYFWTIDQAVDLIFQCMEEAVDAKPFVPEMKSMSIENLLQAMANKYLPDGEELKIKTIGLQVGENQHEKILEDGYYSNEVEQFTVEEIQELI
jgi:UDP-N-acetylglucosamine 4,6-dehydratase/UDP-glucose 4-epimerase|tara:strand:+ start:174 stop:1046 length:873 start_codon:yes stop_codon:yes gene_type:complete